MKPEHTRQMRPAIILILFCIFTMYFAAGCGQSPAAKEEPVPAEADTPSNPAAPDSKTPEAEPAFINQHTIPITYYNQSDPAWAGHLYGGYDSMAAYGCGPAALAIVVSSLTGQSITPVDTAIWSAANHCYSRGYGSAHEIIPNGAAAFGLKVEHMSVLTPAAVRNALLFDKLLVFLMGPGDFSDNGHFIVAYGYEADGRIRIADPASEERSSYSWAAETLLSQLAANPQAAGPVWAISRP